jgi:adenylate kinase
MESQTFVFFGIVGSGKGTQVKLLMDFLKGKDGKECVYVGTGDIFRKILESSDDEFSNKWMKEMLHAGKLMPDENTNKLVSDVVEAESSPDKNLLFDGYPRTVGQSKFFEELMHQYKRDYIKIIYIELSKEEAMKRNLKRGRADDTEAGLNKRFDEYVNNVVPSMNYFKDKLGYQIFSINGEQSIEAVHQEIKNKLNI